MPWSEEKWILNYINANRKTEELVTLENAKGMYIPKERYSMEKAFGKDVVTKIFGEPSFLEKAESMLLKIEKGKISKEQKYEYLISIAYEISNACGKELDSNNPVWDKYATLYTGIPIEILICEKTPLGYPEFTKRKTNTTTKELEVARTWLSSLEAKTNPEKRIYLEYIFELVDISLKRIFKEVKKEIMGE